MFHTAIALLNLGHVRKAPMELGCSCVLGTLDYLSIPKQGKELDFILWEFVNPDEDDFSFMKGLHYPPKQGKSSPKRKKKNKVAVTPNLRYISDMLTD